MAVLEAAKRSDLRGSRLSEIRNGGRVPAVVYGKTFGNEPVTVDGIALIKTLRENGINGVLKLDLDGKQTDVMVHDIQSDTIKNEIIHVDFYAVDMKSEMDANVAVHIVGEAVGVKNGGVIQQTLFDVSVRALPSDIPESIEIDVTNLDINESLQVSDLNVGDKFQINNELDQVILSINPPTEEPEEPEVGGEANAEPELVGDSENGEGNKE